MRAIASRSFLTYPVIYLSRFQLTHRMQMSRKLFIHLIEIIRSVFNIVSFIRTDLSQLSTSATLYSANELHGFSGKIELNSKKVEVEGELIKADIYFSHEIYPLIQLLISKALSWVVHVVQKKKKKSLTQLKAIVTA